MGVNQRRAGGEGRGLPRCGGFGGADQDQDRTSSPRQAHAPAHRCQRLADDTGRGLPGRRVAAAKAMGFGINHYRISPMSPISPIRLILLAYLAVALAAFAQSKDDKQATFFMGRVKYSANDGNDCSGVGQELMQLVSRASTIKIQEERKVRLTDPDLFETPFLFMNGHNDFVLTEPELANLRKYLAHGGFFFASGCCTSPGFPKAWRREFTRIFRSAQRLCAHRARAGEPPEVFSPRRFLLRLRLLYQPRFPQGLAPGV